VNDAVPIVTTSYLLRTSYGLDVFRGGLTNSQVCAACVQWQGF